MLNPWNRAERFEFDNDYKQNKKFRILDLLHKKSKFKWPETSSIELKFNCVLSLAFLLDNYLHQMKFCFMKIPIRGCISIISVLEVMVKDKSLGLLSVSRLKVLRLSLLSRSHRIFFCIFLILDEKFETGCLHFDWLALNIHILALVSSWFGCLVWVRPKCRVNSCLRQKLAATLSWSGKSLIYVLVLS